MEFHFFFLLLESPFVFESTRGIVGVPSNFLAWLLNAGSEYNTMIPCILLLKIVPQ